MNSFLIEYIPIIIFLGLAVGMACLIMLATWLVAKRYPDENKLAPYAWHVFVLFSGEFARK